MRTKHAVHSLPAFPVYSAAFVGPTELVLGGGGGQSKTGIKNKLRLYNVPSESAIELLDELELDKGEDAPMSMAAHAKSREFVCGVNSSLEYRENASNQNCRTYGLDQGKITRLSTQNTLSPTDIEDDYQKVTVLSPDGKLLAVAGTRDLSVLRYPSLEIVAQPVHLSQGEIYDAAFSPSTLVLATTVKLYVYSLPSALDEHQDSKPLGKREASLPTMELIATVDRPSLPGSEAGSSFRGVRFHPQNPKVLYTIVNTVAPKPAKKNAPKRAYICKWDTETWQLKKHRKVSDRALTCFDISPNGTILAFGSSDYTVGVVDALTLAPVLTILKAHDFPPTTLRFNPSSSLLVSGSADCTVRVVSVPEYVGGNSWSRYIVVVVTLLVILFAVIAQQMHQSL